MSLQLVDLSLSSPSKYRRLTLRSFLETLDYLSATHHYTMEDDNDLFVPACPQPDSEGAGIEPSGTGSKATTSTGPSGNTNANPALGQSGPANASPTTPSATNRRKRSPNAKESSIWTERAGGEWADGVEALCLSAPYNSPAFTGLIECSELSMENLPPFYVLLSDRQVGELAEWVQKLSEKSISKKKRLGMLWPADFDTNGHIRKRRIRFGEPYPKREDEEVKTIKNVTTLIGGKKPPTSCMRLPTRTSSGKLMRCYFDQKDKDAKKGETDKKRKARDGEDREDGEENKKSLGRLPRLRKRKPSS